MQIPWTMFVFVCVIVFVTNTAWLAAMYVSQQLNKDLPPRRSTIPGTKQPFLYMQDWPTMRYGDTTSVPCMTIIFVYLVMVGRISTWQWAVFAAIVIAAGIGFLRSCLSKTHKPDWGFPEVGKISLGGWIHLPYFAIGWAIGIFTFGHVVCGHVPSPIVWMWVFGALTYIMYLIREFTSGNFQQLRRT